jgi:hypothetical protein
MVIPSLNIQMPPVAVSLTPFSANLLQSLIDAEAIDRADGMQKVCHRLKHETPRIFRKVTGKEDPWPALSKFHEGLLRNEAIMPGSVQARKSILGRWPTR